MKTNIAPENRMYLTHFPPKEGRYIVFDTETTGLDPKENNVIEIAAFEITNSKLTGNQFHCYLSPRNNINKEAESKHHLHQNFHQRFYSDIFPDDKVSLTNFKHFVSNCLLFAHNAIFDMEFINNELEHFKLEKIPKRKFRCTMKMFKFLVNPFAKKNYSLKYCCDYFKIKNDKNLFHSATYDAFMTAKLIASFYDTIDLIKNMGLEFPLVHFKKKKKREEIEKGKEDEPISFEINKNELYQIN